MSSGDVHGYGEFVRSIVDIWEGDFPGRSGGVDPVRVRIGGADGPVSDRPYPAATSEDSTARMTFSRWARGVV